MSDPTAAAVIVDDSRPGVRRITLNRPDKLNALNDDVRRLLHEAVADSAGREDLRVVVIAGAGRSFSAGADLRERLTLPATVAGERRAHGRWPRLLDDLERLPQATVAALHGYVVGGAALLAAACDLRVAADDTTISIPEVAIGVPLTWAGLPRLAREIGLSRTRELVMTGRRITAAEALAWGLVHRTAPAGELDAAVDDVVDGLLAQPPLPLALTVDGLRALGRALSAPETAWSDADLLRWSLKEGRGDP